MRRFTPVELRADTIQIYLNEEAEAALSAEERAVIDYYLRLLTELLDACRAARPAADSVAGEVLGLDTRFKAKKIPPRAYLCTLFLLLHEKDKIRLCTPKDRPQRDPKEPALRKAGEKEEAYSFAYDSCELEIHVQRKQDLLRAFFAKKAEPAAQALPFFYERTAQDRPKLRCPFHAPARCQTDGARTAISKRLKQKRFEFLVRTRSRHSFLDLAVFKNKDGGNRRNTVLESQLVLFIHIYFADFCFSFISFGQLLYKGSDHAAGTAPLRPEIDQHGNLALQNFGLKVLIRQCQFHSILPNRHHIGLNLD